MWLLRIHVSSFVSGHQTCLLWDPFPAAPRFLSRQRQGETSITFSDRNVRCDKRVYLYPFSGFLTVQQEQRGQVDSWCCLSGLKHERERWNSEGTQDLLSFGIGWEVCCYQMAVESKGKWPLSSLIKTFVFHEIWVWYLWQLCGENSSQEFWKQLMTLDDTIFSENLRCISFANLMPSEIGKLKPLLTYKDLNLQYCSGTKKWWEIYIY